MASYASRQQGCETCTQSHGAVAALELGEEVVRRASRVPGEGLVYRLDAPGSIGLLVEGFAVGSGGVPSGDRENRRGVA